MRSLCARGAPRTSGWVPEVAPLQLPAWQPRRGSFLLKDAPGGLVAAETRRVLLACSQLGASAELPV